MPAFRLISRTLLSHGTEKLAALCGAIGFEDALTDRAHRLFERMTSPWGDASIEQRPRWLSDITDDHSPYEFSLALEQSKPELRMLVEAQPETSGVAAQWAAGRALSKVLERDYGASLARLQGIEDLFAAEDPRARFGIWHAANVRAGAPPEFKVYLNPQAKGRASARAVVNRAMVRLGFPGAVTALPLTGEGRAEVKYFSLDLRSDATARVKVYLALHRATSSDIESAVSLAGNYMPGEVTEMCRALSGHDGPYHEMPAQLCFSFTTQGGNRPVAATLYFPVRAFASSDRVAQSRILAYMAAEDRPMYENVLRAFAGRSLDIGTGMQTYASYRWQNGGRRVTVYLSPEIYSIAPRRNEQLDEPVSRRLAEPVSGVNLIAATDEDAEAFARHHG